MKENIEINKNEENGSYDLIINGIPTETGEDIVDSYFFWEELERAANRAMFRIKKDNPRINFELDIQTMMIGPEAHIKEFLDHLSEKYPNVDVKKIIEIHEAAVAKIKLDGPNDDHPNPFMKLRVDSDLMKDIVSSVVNEYVKYTYTIR